MEGQVWRIVESILVVANPILGRFRYGAQDILRVVLWAVLHDRPMAWACQAEHWPEAYRPTTLPHPSTISRRWRRPALQAEAHRVFQATLDRLGPGNRYAAIDGRPLLVGGCSKDPDARPGRGVGGMGRGYKMHTVVDARHVVLKYEIHPLSAAEQTIALDLLPALPATVTRVVGDTIYDSMKIHHCAAHCGKKMYTKIRENRVGHRQQRRRKQLLALWSRSVGKRFMAWRDEIERTFGQMSTISFGFKGLPAWARRDHRVKRWMWGKTVLYHAWMIHKRPAA